MGGSQATHSVDHGQNGFWGRQLTQVWGGDGHSGGGRLAPWVEASWRYGLWGPREQPLASALWPLLASPECPGSPSWLDVLGGQRSQGGAVHCRERRKVGTCWP